MKYIFSCFINLHLSTLWPDFFKTIQQQQQKGVTERKASRDHIFGKTFKHRMGVFDVLFPLEEKSPDLTLSHLPL